MGFMKRRTQRAQVLIILLLVAAVAASSCQKPLKLEPQVLLTKADAEEILGEPVRDPRTAGNKEIQRLIYSALNSTNAVALSITQTLTLPENLRKQGATAKTMYDLARNSPNEAIQPVEGLGDAAFWGGISMGLNVLVGDVYFIVQANKGEDDAVNLEVSKAAAEKVLSRLPKQG